MLERMFAKKNRAEGFCFKTNTDAEFLNLIWVEAYEKSSNLVSRLIFICGVEPERFFYTRVIKLSYFFDLKPYMVKDDIRLKF